MRIGITGSEGFIGTAFRRYLTALGETPVSFPRGAFDDPAEMSAFCGQCEAVVHFAGLSRHPDGDFLLYRFIDNGDGNYDLDDIGDDDEFDAASEAFDELMDNEDYDEMFGDEDE